MSADILDLIVENLEEEKGQDYVDHVLPASQAKLFFCAVLNNPYSSLFETIPLLKCPEFRCTLFFAINLFMNTSSPRRANRS